MAAKKAPTVPTVPEAEAEVKDEVTLESRAPVMVKNSKGKQFKVSAAYFEKNQGDLELVE